MDKQQERAAQLSEQELAEFVRNFHGELGEEKAFARFLQMDRQEQGDWLIKLAEQIANQCADAEGEVEKDVKYDLDYASVSAGWAGRNAHVLSILLCLFLKRNWDVESERLHVFRRNQLVIPYPGEKL